MYLQDKAVHDRDSKAALRVSTCLLTATAFYIYQQHYLKFAVARAKEKQHSSAQVTDITFNICGV